MASRRTGSEVRRTDLLYPASLDPVPSLFTAIQDLGVEIGIGKGPVAVLVVDSVQNQPRTKVRKESKSEFDRSIHHLTLSGHRTIAQS